MTERLEVDSRITPEIEVVIYYIKEHEICLLSLVDVARNKGVEFVVEPDNVADALVHPFYYAHQMGINFDD